MPANVARVRNPHTAKCEGQEVTCPLVPDGAGDCGAPADVDARAIRTAIAPRALNEEELAVIAKRVREAASRYQSTSALRDAMKREPAKGHRTNLARFELARLIRDCVAAWTEVTGEPVPKQPAGNRTRGSPDHPCIALARLAYSVATGKRLVSDLRRQAGQAI